MDLLVNMCVGLLLFCLAWAAFTDVTRLKVPNLASAIMGALFLVAAAASGIGWAALGWHALIALAALALCFGLFAAGTLGAGDGKMIAMVALWLGPATVPFLLATCVAGLGLIIFILMARSTPLPVFIATHPSAAWLVSGRRIPYAVPIALGAIYGLNESRWVAALPF